MSTITIKHFAEQIGIDADRLVRQLNDAGVTGKTTEDSLTDEEKRQLLEFLKGGGKAGQASAPASPGRGKITLRKKTTSEIQQTTKTGVARTVQVQTKRRRTFVKRDDDPTHLVVAFLLPSHQYQILRPVRAMPETDQQ